METGGAIACQYDRHVFHALSNRITPALQNLNDTWKSRARQLMQEADVNDSTESDDDSTAAGGSGNESAESQAELDKRNDEVWGAVDTAYTELDTLMKYVYRGMEDPEAKKCAALLAWHAAGVAKGGSGCILRVLTSRESV